MCYILYANLEVNVMDVDVFSARDLRNNAGQLLKDARNGRLSLITKHGVPLVLAVPFDSHL